MDDRAACPWGISHKSTLLHPRRSEIFSKCFVWMFDSLALSCSLVTLFFSLTVILIEPSINNKAKLANTKPILQIHMLQFHSIAIWLPSFCLVRVSSWLSGGASIIPLVYAWHSHLPPFVLGDYCPFPRGKCTTSFHAGLWGLPSCQRAVCGKPAQSDFLMSVRLHQQSASFREYHLDETQFLLYPFQRQCTGPAHTLLAEMHRVSPVPTSHCVWPFSFNSHPGSHGVCYQCLL